MSFKSIPLIALPITIAIALSVSGCFVVPDPRAVPTETQYIDYPEQYFRNIVLIPSSSREIKKLSGEILKVGSNIEFIEPVYVLQDVLQKSDSDIVMPISVSDLLNPDNIDRLKKTGLRFIVVLDKYEESSGEPDYIGYPPVAYGSYNISSKLTVGLIDLDEPATIRYLETKAHATSTGAALVVVIETMPAVHKSTFDGMAHQIVTEINKTAFGESTKLTVIAGDWILAEVNIQKAMKLNSAWAISKREELRSNYKKLCESAEQGDYRAQWELGYLHATGLYGVKKDLVLSAMWYGLVESAGHNPGGLDTIRSTLTLEQRTKAEYLYETWKPGQCARVLFETEQNNTN